ncbi:hypothetical protein AB0I49_21875 [Streptomyces sp. NPDC050617]|uniref:hypothetical protein n=1 Tax=Streptomyces sp. NPDC050617 TaxID=3154628 RepID=UPI003420606E
MTSPGLLFAQGQTKITVSSDQSAVAWRAADAQGRTAASGTAPVTGGGAAIGLGGLGPGYYTLTASAGGTTRTAGFGVLTALTGDEHKDRRFNANLHFGWSGGDDAKLLRSMALIGMGGVRTDANWAAIEKTPGAYTWSGYPIDKYIPYAASQGLTTLPVAGYRNPHYDRNKTPSSPAGLAAFGKYQAALVRKYQRQTKEVEVYNEFNSIGFNKGACGITADCYLDMLRAAYGRVHAAVPDAQVVGGALAGLRGDWLKRLYALGGLKYLDAVSVHQYGFPKPPEQALAALPQLRKDLDAAGGRHKPLWMTENGYPTFPGGVTPDAQARYLPRAQLFSFASGVARYYWYDVTDDGTDPKNKEHNFGAFKRPTAAVKAWQPKPAVVTEGVLVRQLAGRAFAGRDGAGPADVHSYRFGTGANTVRTLWTAGSAPRTVTLTTSRPLTVTDQWGHARTYAPSGGTVRLTAGGAVQYVKGPVTGVKAAGADRP